MHLLIVGGSPNHTGGVEAFCARAKEALERQGPHRIETLLSNTAYLSVARLPLFIRSLSALLRYHQTRPDCIWLQYGNILDLFFLALAKLLGFTVLVTPHLGSNWRSQRNPILKALSAWVLRGADRIALLSQTQETEIALPLAVPRSYIRTFLPRVLWDTATPILEERTKPALQLVHAGRLSAGKGTFLFIDVCQRLHVSGVPFAASIVGAAAPGTLRQLNQMIDDYGLRQYVKGLGHYSDVALRDLLRASDVLIHLSSIDSYPLIVLECLAYGVFPVCTDLPGARDIVETYGGHVVSEADAVAETAAFLTSETPVSLRQRSADAAIRVRNDYRWDICAAGVEAALSKTVHGESTDDHITGTAGGVTALR